jgi:hypothetical protein
MTGDPITPTTPGQTVRALGYGGAVRRWMCEGVGMVTRITRAGNPVVRVRADGYNEVTVTDTYGCFRVIDHEGRWVRDGVGA